MQYKRFLHSFAATAVLITPFVINARSVAPNADFAASPAAGDMVTLDGIEVSTRIVGSAGKTTTIELIAENKSKSPITTQIAAALMLSPSVSPMARMVPMPREISEHKLSLSLAPGERYTQKLKVKLPKFVIEQIAQAAKRPTDDASLVEPTATIGPELFARVRSVPPAASQQSSVPQQVASR